MQIFFKLLQTILNLSRTKTLTDKSVIPDYVFDMITNPILMKTSVTTGKVEWAKQFMNNSETNGK